MTATFVSGKVATISDDEMGSVEKCGRERGRGRAAVGKKLSAESLDTATSESDTLGMARVDISRVVPANWDVRGPRLLAPAGGRGAGRIGCPALGRGAVSYELPARTRRRLAGPLMPVALDTLTAASFLWWSYRLHNDFDVLSPSQLWESVTAAATARPTHGSAGRGSYECCDACLHDLGMQWASRLLVTGLVGYHLSLTPSDELTLSQLLAAGRGMLSGYVDLRHEQRHRDHPTAALLVPSQLTGKAGLLSQFVHLHVLTNRTKPLTAAHVHKAAFEAGFGAGGDAMEPVPMALHHQARVIAYVVRQVLTHHPMSSGRRHARYSMWHAAGTCPPPKRPSARIAPGIGCAQGLYVGRPE